MSKGKYEPAMDPRHPALSPTRPLFIDNRDGNTLDRALAQHLQALRREMALPWELCIATAFFNVPGFDLLADELAHVGHVWLLLGAEPTPEAARPPRQPGDPPEPAFTRKLVGDALKTLDAGLARARDLLPFDEATDAAVRRLLGLLHSGKIEVRRYEEQFLHAKAFIFRVVGGGTVVGSSNLTYGGLRGNLELNLGHYEDPVVGKVERWFDELWAKATPFDLAATFDRLMAEYPPYLIYLRVLYALYGDELEQEEEELRAAGEIPLTTFQQHGVWRALRILRKFGGVLIADGVGLGKTFIAGEILRMYRERRQRVLLICPAALRDSEWAKFLHRFQLFAECVSYEELARDVQLGGEYSHLRSPIEEYALVIVDEAHNYRNPDAPARAHVLRRLLMGQRRDLVLLTATPVNNSLWDLYHILRYFTKQDAILADRGVLSIRARFEEAMRADPFNLNPDLLYPIIDATTVKRTRQFVKKHYENDLIKLPDGTVTPIRFPKPVASTIQYDLDEVLPEFLAELEAALMPADEHTPPQLTMARYQPENYPAGQPVGETDTALVGLLRSGLLKRFESSVHAFAETTAKMVQEHDLFLRGLDQGVIVRRELLRELSAADEDVDIDELLATSEHREPADGYDVPALRAAVEADRDLLDRMYRKARQVRPESDPKLKALVEELAKIAAQARKEAIDDEDQRRKHKVLVFSAYEDTIDWIEAFLDQVLEKDRRLVCYRGRTASVAGNESRRGISRQDAIYGFAPETSGAPPGRDADRFDLLLSTDVLAEGMNLQQCRNIINFDLPWNPMRLVQRHGRIDRIGSKHDRVFLRTYFPDRQLDVLLNLEERVRRKLAQAAASVGVEVAPIEHGAVGFQTFTETRAEIERLQTGDASIYEAGGTASAAQTGEEYRQELRRALERMRPDIENLPWKAGSGIAKGNRRGHFFCATVGDRVYLRFVPLPGSGPDDATVSELGTCLRMIECRPDTQRVLPLDLKQTAYAAWQRARRDIHEAWMRETDPANLQPRVSKLNRDIAEFVRQYPPRDIEQSRVEQALDAIEAPCSRREENLLRAVYEQEYPSYDAKSKALIEEVERNGLEPFAAPTPLPPIQPEEIHLVCWMAIERAAP